MPPAIGGTLTIIFDAGISSVTMFGTTINTSGGSISDFSTGYPETCVGTFVLNSGYAIDTITFNADYAEAGTLSGYTNSDFSIDAGVGSISGTLTITTKEATNPYNIKITSANGIKLLTKDKTIEFTDDVKVTIDESLLGGGGVSSWEDTTTENFIDLSVWQTTSTYKYTTKNGNYIYFSPSSDSNTGYGIYCLDLINNTCSKIYSLSSGYCGDFYETNKGDVYTSVYYSSAGATGIIHLNGTTATLVYDLGIRWNNFFEDSKGNVYVGSSDSSSIGIIHLNGNTATQIYNSDYYWKVYFEDSSGNVYASNYSVTGTGVLHLNGTTVTRVYSSGYRWSYFCESSNGIVYVGTNDSSTKGILRLNGASTASKIYGSGYGWQYWFADSKGNVYVGSGNSSTIGLLHILNSTVTTVYSTGYYWHGFFEDSKGNIYASANSATESLLHLNGTTATKIYSTGYYWEYFFEDSKGNVYVGSSTNSAKGLLHLNGTTVTQVYTSGYNWIYFFEDSKDNVYVGGTSGSTGVLHLNGTTVTRVHDSSYNWRYLFEDSKCNVYISSTSSSNVLYLDGNNIAITTKTATTFCIYKYANKSGIEFLTSTTTKPNIGDLVVRLDGANTTLAYYTE